MERLFTTDIAMQSLVGTLEIDLAASATMDPAAREEWMAGIAEIVRNTDRIDEPLDFQHHAEIVLIMPVDGKRVFMQSRTKVVVDEHLLTRLREAIGDPKAVRIRGRRPSLPQRRRKWTKKRQQVGA